MRPSPEHDAHRGEGRPAARPLAPHVAIHAAIPAPPPRSVRGLLAIAYLSLGRATGTGVVTALLFGGVPILCLAAGIPRIFFVVTAGAFLPAGLLVLPLVGVLQGQRLAPDYRHIGGGLQVRLWLRGPRVRGWLLPAGSLADAAIRRHAALIQSRDKDIAPLGRGARATLAAELREALAGVTDGDEALARIDETAARVRRWEGAAIGLPPVGAKLYLRHDPLSPRAEAARRAAARLGVPSDHLNYFWRGQVLLLPPARSYRTLAALIDALLAAGVADSGQPLPLQITVQGALGDGAKLIALVQLASSGLDFAVQGPERRGDEGNLITRGRFIPERVAGDPGRDRTDFLFSQIWATVPVLAAAGYADQHHRDLRVVQTLAAALVADQTRGTPRGAFQSRLAAVWQEFAADFTRLCIAWGAPAAVTTAYLDQPFAAVRHGVEILLERKRQDPDLVRLSRRSRDRALALTEFTMATAALTATGRVRIIRVSTVGGVEEVLRYRRGLRRVRRAIRTGARVAILTRAGDTMQVLLEDATTSGTEV